MVNSTFEICFIKQFQNKHIYSISWPVTLSTENSSFPACGSHRDRQAACPVISGLSWASARHPPACLPIAGKPKGQDAWSGSMQSEHSQKTGPFYKQLTAWGCGALRLMLQRVSSFSSSLLGQVDFTGGPKVILGYFREVWLLDLSLRLCKPKPQFRMNDSKSVTWVTC